MTNSVKHPADIAASNAGNIKKAHARLQRLIADRCKDMASRRLTGTENQGR